jgi:hypothetical protein
MIFSATTLFSKSFSTKVIDILLVGGGGGGGAITGSRGIRTFLTAGGGGGAGGYISSQLEITSASVLSITIGDGGTGGCLDTTGNPCGYATNGTSSVLNVSSSLYSIEYTAVGGGAGGNFSTITNTTTTGGTGGSGGGNSGAAIQFQGNVGAASFNLGSGGGGGANTAGYGGSTNIAGGDGKQWYDGNYYAGGGGAGVETNPGIYNEGGLGGGGRGGYRTSSSTFQPSGTAGTTNTGGGGGGKGRQQDTTGAGTFTGGTGGSGICKIRYYGTGSIFSAGSSSFNSGDGYTYYTFTSSVSISGSF